MPEVLQEKMNLQLDSIKTSCVVRERATSRFHEMFMFKRDLKGVFITTANQFINQNVYWSTILGFLKNVSLQKTQ